MSDFAKMNDEQLIALVASAENGEAVAELVSRYTGLVLRLAGKYSASADYEELVSDGIDALINAAYSFSPGRGGFGGFAFTCVSNRMKNLVSRASRRREQLVSLPDENFPDSAPSPEELVIGEENAAELTDRMRHILSPLELRCIEGVILGMSRAEIAEKLSISVKSADNAVTRARAKLREIIPRL